jgi:hypothetical protein
MTAKISRKYLISQTLPLSGHGRHGVLPAEEFVAALCERRKMSSVMDRRYRRMALQNHIFIVGDVATTA